MRRPTLNFFHLSIPLSALSVLVAGCANSSPIVTATPQSLQHRAVPIERLRPESARTLAETGGGANRSLAVLTELSVLLANPAATFQTSDASAGVQARRPAGPQLVAGDWLAWQCAMAGGYWDLPTKNAPAYAEAALDD